jgi:hypothetical protein
MNVSTKEIEQHLLNMRDDFLKLCTQNDKNIQDHKNGIADEESKLKFNQQMIRQINYTLERL